MSGELEVQLTQERNLCQKATVKQFTSEVNQVNRPSLPSLFHHGVHFSHCFNKQFERSEPVCSPVKVVKLRSVLLM